MYNVNTLSFPTLQISRVWRETSSLPVIWGKNPGFSEESRFGGKNPGFSPNQANAPLELGLKDHSVVAHGEK